MLDSFKQKICELYNIILSPIDDMFKITALENYKKEMEVSHERSFSEDCHFTLEKVCMGIGVRENLPDDYFSGETNQIMIPQKGVREMTVSDNGNNTQEWEFKDLDEEASSIWLKSAENEIFSGGVN